MALRDSCGVAGGTFATSVLKVSCSASSVAQLFSTKSYDMVPIPAFLSWTGSVVLFCVLFACVLGVPRAAAPFALNLDCGQMGVGGNNTWNQGARPLPAYQLRDASYAYDFLLRPYDTRQALQAAAQAPFPVPVQPEEDSEARRISTTVQGQGLNPFPSG